jgi:hypothetical protein
MATPGSDDGVHQDREQENCCSISPAGPADREIPEDRLDGGTRFFDLS